MANINSYRSLTSAGLGRRAVQALGATAGDGGEPESSLDGSSRLFELLSRMEKLMAEKYAFDVFAKDSINFGTLVTYRQKWEPERYQVGDLISTIPLAPREMKRYTTRTVVKKSRAQKELEDNLQTRRYESTDTARVDQEIVQKAEEKTNFHLSAKESFGQKDSYQIDATQSAGGDTAKSSQQTKRNFRESVLKSAEEYKQQHRVEIETNESQETEGTTFHEIQNPNDELAVTYMFYELQRTYRISEKIHKLTPVILVANDVPAPHEIDDAWLTKHDWILRRVILDDSFRSALEYLTDSFVGAEVNIRILEANATAQKAVVDKLNQQIQLQMEVLSMDEQSVQDAMEGLIRDKQQEGIFNTVKRIFDPIGITGKVDSGHVDAAQAMVDYTKEMLDRAEREKARLLSQLQVAMTALQAAVDKLANAVREHYDRVAEIDRLRVHIKDNILYYMQAIWRHEPPDQRFFRLYNIDVPDITPDTAGMNVSVTAATNEGRVSGRNFGSGENETMSVRLPMPPVSITTKKLVEIADLDNVLAYKGNYMVFALKENNYITLHMMQDYLEVGEDLVIRDPDEFGNYTVEDLQELATCLHSKDPDEFQTQYRDTFKQAIIDRLTSNRKDHDLVIVPTKSLFIECLVGTHPLLEDFKLIHRALDVKKVQAEVRRAELENIRLAARALEGKRSDPDIDKVVVVGENKNVTIDVD
jgi:hypothetical protein